MKTKRLNLFLPVTLLMLISCASAQRGAIGGSYSLIDKGEYYEALRKLSRAEHYEDSTPEVKAEIFYLKARCYEGLRSFEEAKALYEHIIKDLPDSSYSLLANARLKTLKKR